MEQEKTVKESYYCNVFADGAVSRMKHNSLEDARKNRALVNIETYIGVNNYIIWSDGSVETHYIPD